MVICIKPNSIDNKISYICTYEWRYFLNKLNVFGIGLGYKIKNNYNTFEKCIKVFVYKKKSKYRVNRKDLIPRIYKGIKTDVIEIGNVTLDILNTVIRPVIGGYSIGPASYEGGGTVGCLVSDKQNTYLLSNNHTIARYNTTPIDTPIVQPAIVDGGIPGRDTVAFLSKYIPLKFISTFRSPVNYTDCAIAKVIPKSIASPQIAFVGYPNCVIPPILDRFVKKVGRTTELSFGRVTDIKVTIRFPFSSIGKQSLMQNQIITTKMSTKGDSGAVLLDNYNNVMGLLMGSSTTVSIFNDIRDVLKLLDVKLVTN